MVAASGLRHFSLWYIQLEDSMTQRSDVFVLGRFQPPWEIPHEYLKGWGNLSGNIISIKRNHYFNLVSFFSNSDFPSRICCHFFGTTLFLGEALLHTFWNCFDPAVTFSGQLFLQNNCCFLLFQNSHFFAEVIFSE